MSDVFKVKGIPERWSNGRDPEVPGKTVHPLRNPAPAPPLSPVVSREDAHAALLQLAQADGWYGLYDPTNADSVTVDGDGVIIELRDSLGNMPPLAPLTGVIASNVGDAVVSPMGSCYGFTGGLSAPFTQGFQITMALDSEIAYPVFTTDSTNLLDLLRSVMIKQQGSVSAAFSGESSQRDQMLPSVGPSVLSVDTQRGTMWAGERLVIPDGEPVETGKQVRTHIAFAPFEGVMGPVFVSLGEVSPDVRARATHLLENLTGAMATVPAYQPAGEESATIGPDGELVAGHRPDRPGQLASVTKLWTCYLAMKALRAYADFVEYPLDDVLDITITVQEGTGIGGDGSKQPPIHPGDKISIRDLFHGCLMHSINAMADQIAIIGDLFGKPFLPDYPTGPAGWERFVQYMNQQATEVMGWDEAVFTTPQGRYDSIMTPRHVAELLHLIDQEEPFIREVIGKLHAPWHVDYAPGYEDNPADGTYTNIVRDGAGGQPFPELLGGKTGDQPKETGGQHTVALLWHDPVSGKTMATVALNTGNPRFQSARRQMDVARNRYNAPANWSTTSDTSTAGWSPEGYAVAAVNPGSDDAATLAPFDRYREPHPIVKKGDTITLTVQTRASRGLSGVRKHVRLRLAGGFFTNGSPVVETEFDANRITTTQTVNATVRRGGVLTVEMFLTGNNIDGVGLWAKDAQLTITSPPASPYYLQMDTVDYQLTETTQPLGDGGGGAEAANFTATLRVPEQEPMFVENGVRYLKGKTCQLTTRHGVVNGTIINADSSNGVDITVDCMTEMGALNAYNVTAPPFSGTLGELLATYMGLIAETAPDFTIDPALTDRPVVAPGWTGELWHYLKQLCAAERMQVVFRPEGGIHFAPIAPRTDDLPEHASIQYRENGSSLAETVEVIRYNSRRIENMLIYPPEGPSDGEPTITVGPGEYAEFILELGASVETFDEPVYVDYVSRGHTESSVYTIVDNAGDTVPLSMFKNNGGLLKFELMPDRTSIKVSMKAPDRINRDQFEVITSYSLASGANDSATPYPTLRIIGTGIYLGTEKITYPTGVPKLLTGTRVGTTVDNFFIRTASQASYAGKRAAIAYSGFSPEVQVTALDAPAGEWGQIGGLVNAGRMDYRITGASYTPDGVQLTGEYHTRHTRHDTQLDGMDYDTATQFSADLTYADEQNRGITHG